MSDTEDKMHHAKLYPSTAEIVQRGRERFIQIGANFSSDEAAQQFGEMVGARVEKVGSTRSISMQGLGDRYDQIFRKEKAGNN